MLISLLIVLAGLVIGASVLGLEIHDQIQTQSDRFHTVAGEAFLKFESAMDDYKVSGLWLHQACHNRNMSFEAFRELYQYVTSTGLEFQGVSCAFNVNADERPILEEQSTTYLAKKYPNFNYTGFTGCVTEECLVGPRSPNASSYLTLHFVEPLENQYNRIKVDFDMSSSTSRDRVVEQALVTGNLSVTERLRFLPPPKDKTQPYECSIIMAHPGIEIDKNATETLHDGDVAILVIRFAGLCLKAHREFVVEDDTRFYAYVSTVSVATEQRHFLHLNRQVIGHLISDAITDCDT